MTALRTEAWLLLGLVSSLPGELVLRDGAISFVAWGTGSAWPSQLRRLERLLGTPGIAKRIEDEDRTAVFRWPVGEVSIRMPWHYFGGGLKIRRDTAEVRISFGRPANTRGGVEAGSLGAAAENLREVAAMRDRGRMWIAAIERARSPRPDR